MTSISIFVTSYFLNLLRGFAVCCYSDVITIHANALLTKELFVLKNSFSRVMKFYDAIVTITTISAHAVTKVFGCDEIQNEERMTFSVVVSKRY